MATFKVCVRKKRKDGYYNVYIRVTHNRQSSYIKTDRVVNEKGVDKFGEVKDMFVMKYCLEKISSYIERLNKVNHSKWSIKEITEFVQESDEDISFSDYARKYKLNMARSGMERNARNYELSYQNLEKYAGTPKLMFSRFTAPFIEGWIKTLMNTSRAKEMYPICVRQIFNEAVKEFNDYDKGYIRIKTNPWIRVKIPSSDVPEKRAIAPEKVREFFSAPIPESKFKSPIPEIGRDVALMVMCLAGINTVDIYHLKKENLVKGVICYNRRKTMKFRKDKSYLEIRIPDILKPIFEKYKSSKDSEHLLCFAERYTSEDSFNANVNIGIKKICESIGIPKENRYCVYTFRHTWGTVAQNNCSATMEDIAFSMNHSSAHKVTECYVRPDYSRVSILNQKVIDFLFFSAPEEVQSEIDNNSMEFRVSPKYQIKGEAYFRGRVIASLLDIGFNNKNEVIKALIDNFKEEIPNRSMVQFRLENTDKNQFAVYERMKGKSF